MGTFWVTDTLACLGTIPVSMQEKLSALTSAMGNDRVHFSVQGRYNLFTNLAKTIYGLKNGTIGKRPRRRLLLFQAGNSTGEGSSRSAVQP
jgi:hypothetical protein